MEDYFIWAGL